MQQLGITPLQAPSTRTYEGGGEQAFFGERLIFKASFFHNELGRQIEYVGLDIIPQLIPGLTPAQQAQLEQTLQADGAYEQSLNTQAYRAMGVETTVESGIGKGIFLRGGYTYLDAVIQRSFANDDVALLGPGSHLQRHPRRFRLAIAGSASVPQASAHRIRVRVVLQQENLRNLYRRLRQPFRRLRLSGWIRFNGGNSLLLPNRNLD